MSKKGLSDQAMFRFAESVFPWNEGTLTVRFESYDYIVCEAYLLDVCLLHKTASKDSLLF
jgi:hypothetical protein